MGDFSSAWLRLREPVDRRARNPAIAAALRDTLASRAALRVTDLGCGAGAHLRATAPLLGPRQHWTLVDSDAALLDAAADELAVWADSAQPEPGGLMLHRAGRTIVVAFRLADLSDEPDRAIAEATDLVTASAFFDLVSPAFIDRVAAAVTRRGAAFLATLTYDGAQRWTPAHPADTAVVAAFNMHQRNDKGFGSAAGPDAPALLAQAFRAAGYCARSGDSPWRLGAADAELIAALATGTADAVAETGLVASAALAAWRSQARAEAIIGHVDTLALPME